MRALYRLLIASGIIHIGIMYSQAAIAQSQEPLSLLQIEKVQLQGFTSAVPVYRLSSEFASSGVSLGGIGAGFIDLRPDGKFHESAMRNNWLATKPPPPMRLNLTIGTGKDARSYTLLSSLPEDHTAVTEYVGHFPIADLSYRAIGDSGLKVDIRAFSAFIPGSLNLSAYPGAIIGLRIQNSGKVSQHLSIAFDCRNDLERDTLQQPPAKWTLSSIKSQDTVGFGLGSTSARGGYALAASPKGWSAHAGLVAGSKEGERGAIMLTGEISPGEEKHADFSFTWYFPSWQKSNGAQATNRYSLTQIDASSVCQFLLANRAALERAIVLWQQAIYAREIPDWMKDALINSLYLMVRKSVLLEDGRLLFWESLAGSNVCQSLTTQLFYSAPILLMFPDLQKQSLMEFSKLQTSDGQIPSFLTGYCTTTLDPNKYQKTIGSAIFSLLCWQTISATGDKAFASSIYPSAKRAIQFMMTLDTDGDGLINEHPDEPNGTPSNHFLDNWPWHGTSAPVAGLGLAALSAGSAMAKSQRDTEFEGWCNERLAKSKAKFETDLYTGSYYRLFTDPDSFKQSDTIYANQLLGYVQTSLSGNEAFLPDEHIQSALKTVLAKNRSSSGLGVIAGVGADGLPDPSGAAQSSEVVSSDVYSLLLAGLYATKQNGDQETRQSALLLAQRTYEAVVSQGNGWALPFVQSAKTGKNISGAHTTSNLILWAIPLAYEGASLQGRAWVGKR